MVALKTYSPSSLGFSPFDIAKKLADPFDYDGALTEMAKWNQLANQESQAVINEQKAIKDQRENDQYQPRIDAYNELLAEDPNPSAADSAAIELKLGNIDKALQYMQLDSQQKAAQKKQLVSTLKDAATIAKTDLDYANKFLDYVGASQIFGPIKAPPQRTKEGKEKSPKTEFYVNPSNNDTKVIDANSPEQIKSALGAGYYPAKQLNDLTSLGIDLSSKSQGQTTSAEDTEPTLDKIGKKLYGVTQSAVPTATPAPTGLPKPPPGHLLVRDKVTNEIKVIPKR